MTASAAAPSALAAVGEVLVAELFDDAAMYPPGNLPLSEAVRAHLAHRAGPYGFAVGPFVCSVDTAPAAAAEAGTSRLAVSLIAPAIARIPDARAAGSDIDNLSVVGVEVALGDSDPAALAALVGAEGPATFIEVPAARVTKSLARQLSAIGLRLKLRTGGMTASAFPSEHDLSAAIATCLDVGLPFKCTAGMHNAIRHRDRVTGFEHHGFLNVVAAVAAGRTGGAAAVKASLREQNGSVIAAQIRTFSIEQLVAVRAMFRSFGTCSIADPLADLAALGLAARSGQTA